MDTTLCSLMVEANQLSSRISCFLLTVIFQGEMNTFHISNNKNAFKFQMEHSLTNPRDHQDSGLVLRVSQVTISSSQLDDDNNLTEIVYFLPKPLVMFTPWPWTLTNGTVVSSCQIEAREEFTASRSPPGAAWCSASVTGGSR